MQQPKSKLGDLFKERQAIKDHLANTCTIDELSIERLKRRFREALTSATLSRMQQAAIYHELACLVGFQGRYSEVLINMDLSAGLGMDPFAVAFSRAYLALLNGRVMDARQVVSNLNDALPPSSIPLLRAHQAQVGMLGDFMADNSLDNDFQQQALEAKKIILRLGVDDLEITKRLDAACQLIKANVNHPLVAYKLFAKEDEGILYRFMVNASTRRLVELNELVLDMLLDRFDDEIDRELSILVTPWTPGDHRISEEAYRVGVL
jgi:hypothetical protein